MGQDVSAERHLSHLFDLCSRCGRPPGHVPVAHPAPAVSGTANVKKNSSERKMKEDNEHVQRTIQEQNGQSRREFILTSALAVAGAGAAGILNPARAFGGESKYPSVQENGPYPTEGMAAYSETGPLKLMQFQRELSVRRTWRSKFTTVEFVILTSTRSMVTGARSNIRKSWVTSLAAKS